MTKNIFQNRINYSGDLKILIKKICDFYNVGKLKSFSIIQTGFEDCNIILETEKGKFVAKIFAKYRKKEDIARYANIMQEVFEARINHPKLFKNIKNKIVSKIDKISLVLMEFCGKTFFELNRVPNESELDRIVKIASKINKTNYKPKYIYDSWAIPNIIKVYEKVKKYLSLEDSKMIEQVLEKYKKIPLNLLKKCFVHGDLTKANLLKDEKGKIYAIDFSVSNYYPRIQEIAIIVANLLHDEKNEASLSKRIDIVKKLYNKYNPLTKIEEENLYSYSLAGIAMELLGAYHERYIFKNDIEETDYWLKLGRDGLKKELNIKD